MTNLQLSTEELLDLEECLRKHSNLSDDAKRAVYSCMLMVSMGIPEFLGQFVTRPVDPITDEQIAQLSNLDIQALNWLTSQSTPITPASWFYN